MNLTLHMKTEGTSTSTKTKDAMNHFRISNVLKTERPQKVFVVNSTTSSVKNKKLFEHSEFFLFSYEDSNFKKVSEVLTFLFRFCVKTKMKRH